MQNSLLVLENNLNNLCFVCLATSTLIYWVQSSLKLNNIKIGSTTVFCANILLFSSLILRWYNSKHFPLSNHA